jgi:hypothetical protein
MTECIKESKLTVTLLSEDIKKALSEILSTIEAGRQMGEIGSVVFRDIHNRTLFFQVEKDFDQPATLVVNSLAGESRQYSYSSSFSYVVTHEPHRRQGERCGITEYNNGVPITFYIEGGFTYYGANPAYYGQHFYLEHENNRCCLYRANREVVFGQVEYVKTGNPLLCSA